MLHLLPYYGIVAVLLGSIVAAAYSRHKSIRLTARGWEDLLLRFQPVELNGVKFVAQDYLNPNGNQTGLEPRELLDSVGGHTGLRRMCANAELMLALAAHAQQWDFKEAAIVGERMRRDALRLKRAVLRIELGYVPLSLLRRFWLRSPFHLQEAAAAYYLMRQRLLALYETSHSGRYLRLAEVL